MRNLSVLAFLDVSNVFNFTNVLAYSYGFTDNGLPRVEAQESFPIIPTLGVTLKF